MRKISVCFINLLLLLPVLPAISQDTVSFPLKLRLGIDLAGPGLYYLNDKNNMNIEGYLSVDRNEKTSMVAEVGYLDYKYSQYNYSYLSKGYFARVGVDFNLLKPDISRGIYQAGIGFRYGISLFSSETPFLKHDNYWGSFSSSIPSRSRTGHFIEVTPGVRAEILKNVSLGWNLRLRLLISGGGNNDIRPIYFPGYGNGGKKTAAGISYYLTWNIPWKVKTVITRPPIPEEPDEDEDFPSDYDQRQSIF